MAPKAEAAAPSQTGTDPELMAWVNRNIPDFLLALYPVRGAARADHFSLDQCRIMDSHFIELVFKVRKSYTHSMSFKNGCDAQGSFEMELGKEHDMNLQVRKLGGVERIQGKIGFDFNMEKDQSNMKELTVISDAVGLDSSGAVFVKFELKHRREGSFNMAIKGFATTANKGTARITEFKGRPVSFTREIDLDHIDF